MILLHIAETLKGGVSTHLNELIKIQEKDSTFEKILVCVPEGEREFLEEFCERVEVIYIKNYRRGLLGLLSLLLFCLRLQYCRKFDLAHVHSSFAGLTFRLAALFHFSRSFKIVYCAHSWSFNRGLSARKKNFYVLIERILSHSTDVILNLSEYDSQMAIANGVRGKSSVIISNGMSDLEIEPQEAISDDVLNIVFAGRFDKQKGIDFLASLAPLLDSNRVKLHIVGDAVRGGEVVDFRRFAFAKLYGWIPRLQLLALIKGSDILIVPSKWEGMPYIVIEAMCMGVMVVASDVPPLNEMVVPEFNGLLFDPAESASALAETLNSLSKDAVKSMGLSARKSYLQSYTSDRMADSMLEVYRSVVRAI